MLAATLLPTTSGCAGNATTEPERAYVLDLEVDDSGDEYRYVAVDPVDVRVGDEVTFTLTNTGTLVHDLRVVSPDGNALASTRPTAPGATAQVTVRFDEPGFHRLDCLVDDHLVAHGMQSFVEVTEPDA